MWDIASQTEIKLAILRKYLGAWATILKGQRILYYVDGFAGPGWLWDRKAGKRVPGSPVQTIQLYLDHRLNKGWNYELRLVNIEKKKMYFAQLEKETSKYKNEGVLIRNIHGEFLDKLEGILSEISQYHTFFFIDPFGISGIEFLELEVILRRRNTEILLNFNYDGLQRCIGDLKKINVHEPKMRAKAKKTTDRVCGLLNITEQELDQIVTSSGISKYKQISLLKKYRDNLWKYKTYVYPLPINFPGTERTFYYLIFMTENIIALKIMKDVMKKAKKMEKGQQLFLALSEIDIDALRTRLFDLYAGKAIAIKEIYKDWLPKASILDGEDYLARDIDKALNSMAKDPDMPVSKVAGEAAWNPIYRFGRL
jgi:three-Cys-motif partner protein